MEIGLGATVKLFRLYLEDGLAPSLDLLHMRISPWYQFSRRISLTAWSRLYGRRSARRRAERAIAAAPEDGGRR